ncbi:hypothetical protein TorRG33x02_168380 [Trema orientale]|uniref:Uncharacterized protein n=1 Tax=Trema orientale TaxID=63057 RepID=A0A2P5EP84_TREOI|nr:hypothetical protein TorRG33x02_168380 [Trema orientale]
MSFWSSRYLALTVSSSNLSVLMSFLAAAHPSWKDCGVPSNRLFLFETIGWYQKISQSGLLKLHSHSFFQLSDQSWSHFQHVCHSQQPKKEAAGHTVLLRRDYTNQALDDHPLVFRLNGWDVFFSPCDDHMEPAFPTGATAAAGVAVAVAAVAALISSY